MLLTCSRKDCPSEGCSLNRFLNVVPMMVHPLVPSDLITPHCAVSISVPMSRRRWVPAEGQWPWRVV